MPAPLREPLERSRFVMGMLSLPLALPLAPPFAFPPALPAETGAATGRRPGHGRRDPVEVGAVLSLTGDHGDRGTAARLALDAFQRTWRFHDGRRVRFLVVDVRSDYRLVAAAAPELKERGAVAIIGPDSGRELVPAFAELEAVALPVLVGPPVPYPNFNQEPYFFSPNLPQEPMQLDDLLAYVADLGLPHPVLLTTDDERGHSRAQLWRARGGAAELAPAGTADYLPVLSRLREAGYDSLTTILPGGHQAALVALARAALGWNVDHFLDLAAFGDEYLTEAAGAAEGTRGFLWPAGAGSAYFPRHSGQAKAVRAIEHAMPDVDLSRHPLVGHIWDQALALALAIQRAGSTEAEAVRRALENLGHWGVNGFNRRTPQDHVGYQRQSAIRAVVRDGSIVPL